MEVSIEGGESPALVGGELSSSRGLLCSFSLACSLWKPSFAINLAKNLSSVP